MCTTLIQFNYLPLVLFMVGGISCPLLRLFKFETLSKSLRCLLLGVMRPHLGEPYSDLFLITKLFSRQTKTLVLVVWNERCELINIGYFNLVDADANTTADVMFDAVDAVSEAEIANSKKSLIFLKTSSLKKLRVLISVLVISN